MSTSGMTKDEIARLLDDWGRDDPKALNNLTTLVLDDIRFLARRALAKEFERETLQTTELVNEVYLRLAGRRSVQWKNQDQFFGYLAGVVHCILVDRARRHLAAKRGSRPLKVPLDGDLQLTKTTPESIVAVDDALQALAAVDSRQCRIVKLRFFVGLTHDEIAKVLGLSPRQVARDWRNAKAFLRRVLGGG